MKKPLFLAVAVCGMLALAQSAEAPDNKLNILFCFADDWGRSVDGVRSYTMKMATLV